MSGARDFLFRLAFSIGVLALVLAVVDVSGTWQTLTGLEPLLLLLSFVCYFATRVVVAFKWWLLLGGRTAAVSYAVVQRAIFLADYQALLFPNTLAADAMRLVLLRHHPRGMTYMASTIIADRVVNVMVAAAMALLGMVLLYVMGITKDPVVIGVVVGAAAFLLAAGTALLLNRPFALAMLLLERVLAHGPLRKPTMLVAGKARELHGSMAAVLAHPETLAKAVVLSVVVVLLRIAVVYCLFLGIEVVLGLLPLLAIYPIIMLLVLLPISILGIGVQDGAFIFFFSSMGVAASSSLAVSIAVYAVIIAASILAGIAALAGPAMPKAAGRPSDTG